MGSPRAVRYGLCLTTGRDSKGQFVAICSDGSPQLGHANPVILAVDVVEDQPAAEQWFQRMQRDRPWEPRH